MLWAAAGIAFAVVAITIAMSSSSSTRSGGPPGYELVDDGRGFLVAVVETDDPEELRAVVEDVRAGHRGGDGWHLAVDCRWGGTAGAANRLANARWADTPLGAARTGLAAGDIVFEPTGRRCAPPGG